MKILVTGASGFIGSELVNQLVRETSHQVTGICRSADPHSLRRLTHRGLTTDHTKNLRIRYADLSENCSGFTDGIDCVFHLAAATFVDHSIRDPDAFIRDNVIATHRLLEDARKHKVKKFVLVSTDEVLGNCPEGYLDETAPMRPRNPYAATKAAAENLAHSYVHTYGLNVVISRTENNCGPYQSQQKVIPSFVYRLSLGLPVLVYGDGQHRRQWIHVSDHVKGLRLLMDSDVGGGDVYHIAGSHELTNLELADLVISTVQPLHKNTFELIPDHDIRPGHDRRYAISSERIRALGWKPEWSLVPTIQSTARWYRDNLWWFH